MKKRLSKLSSVALIALIVFGVLSVFPIFPVNADPTDIEVIATEGLVPGTNDSNFTLAEKTVSDTFIVNLTVVDVSELQNWQTRLTWDSALLDFVSISLPTDHVFAASGKAPITPPPDTGPGYVIWGCTYINSDPKWNFNGTGTLCQVELEIIQGVPPDVSCDLAITSIGVDTFLVDADGIDIPFSVINGRYFYWWVTPPYPNMYIKPATYMASTPGQDVDLEIWVEDVHAGWEIIGFQFSLMWNTTFLTPRAPYFTNGTFLEGFETVPDGVLYAPGDINQHDRPPPLHPIPYPDYNFSRFGALLFPTPVAGPFPSGEGLLMTVHFSATDHYTLSPDEDWTWIEFIMFEYNAPPNDREDTYAMYMDGLYTVVLPISTEPCHYRAPQVVLGLNIDLYTQYSSPYGGQGPHMPSDMFGPQQEVLLCATVTYNEWPVQQKLVGFEIRHGDYTFLREDATDEYGVACITFRIPWPCEDPEGEIFGKWIVIATVEVAEEVVNDTLGFWVWWKAFVLSIEPKSTYFYHSAVHPKGYGDDMEFTVEYATYSMQEIDVTLTATIYDQLGFFIGSAYLDTTIGWDEYKYYDFGACEEPPLDGPYDWDVTIPLPSHAVVGEGTAYANAFDKFPWIGGVPYCPEVTNTNSFYISIPI